MNKYLECIYSFIEEYYDCLFCKYASKEAAWRGVVTGSDISVCCYCPFVNHIRGKLDEEGYYVGNCAIEGSKLWRKYRNFFDE